MANEPDNKVEPDQKDSSESTLAAVKEIADGFKESLREMREANTATPTPASGPSLEEQQAQLQAEYNSMMEEYEALCAEGKFADGANKLLAFSNKVAASSRQTNLEEDPTYKAMAARCEKDFKTDHPDIATSYGDEVRAIMARKPAAARMNPSEWDEAVKQVKSNHIDDIIADAVNRAKEQSEADLESARQAARRKKVGERSSGFAPQARGSVSATGEVDTVELQEGDYEAAAILGFTEEEYAEAIAANEVAKIKKGIGRGMVRLVPDKVEAGKF